MDSTIYGLIAIVVANGSGGLALRLVERRLPELKGALNGFYTTVMLVVFSFFFYDLPFISVSPLFLLSAIMLLRSVRRRYLEICETV